MTKTVFIMGALNRTRFRRICMMLEIDYQEDKRFLDSLFIVRGEEKQIELLRDAAEQMKSESITEDRSW